MRFLKEYNQFIFEEWSKNEPIPEIIGVDRGLAIFVIGAPGIGKSYFVTLVRILFMTQQELEKNSQTKVMNILKRFMIVQGQMDIKSYLFIYFLPYKPQSTKTH